MPKWLEFIETSPSSADESDWTARAVAEIVGMDVFKSLVDAQTPNLEFVSLFRPYTVMRRLIIIQHIKRMFTNKKRNVKVKAIKEAGHDFDKCFESLRLGSRCWAHFVSEVDGGRDLFRRLNYQRIREAAASIEAASPAGAFSAALAQEWAKEDKDTWNRKARDFVDVFQ